MTKTFTHDGEDFQFSKKTGLYLPSELRKQVDPSLTEKAVETARKPLIYGLTALTLAGGLAPSISYADSQRTSVGIENTLEANEKSDAEIKRTRLKASNDVLSFTYDMNNSDSPDEAKLWINALAKDGWYAGVLVEGQTDNRDHSYADIGGLVSKKIGNNNYEVFIGPTVEPGISPCLFYQLAVRDTSGSKNLVLPIIDDKSKPFKLDEIDFRPYFTGQFGDFFGGIGTRQKGDEITRIYGGFGFNNEKAGSVGVFRYFPNDKKGKFKIQSAFTEPKSSINLSLVNIWNDLEGPGIRDVGTPYFSSFLGKGNLTSLIEGNFSPEFKDYQIMVGKDLKLAGLGLGVNYHEEDGKTAYSGLIHVVKNIDLDKIGKMYIEGKYNTRDKCLGMFGSFKTEF